MAKLPDPRESASPEALAEIERMASVRSHAEGHAELGQVYISMFNNPEVAQLVGGLGEHLRFEGVLPDAVRESVILRTAARRHFAYEWSHHVRPATLAGLEEATIAALAEDAVPAGLEPEHAAAIEAADRVLEGKPIPEEAQARIVGAWGTKGAVELVALCGLYELIGSFVVAFGIEIEPGFPQAPFEGGTS
jgi:4-carboxymuconolactone decarboxylase